MPDDSRFRKDKSIVEHVTLIATILFDVISSFILSVPLLLRATYRLFYFKRKDVRGKVAVVTGGANGLGRAMCLRLAELGCNIALADLDLTAGEIVADEIRSRGVKVKAYKVDVTKQTDVLKLRNDVCNDFGVIDILINNAGLMSHTNMEEKPEFIEAMVKVNVLGPILMSKCFLELMKRQTKGHIVSISSMAGLNASPHSIPYSSTKFAVQGFMAALTEHLRLEKLSSKIKTTCVFPYYIKTRQDIIDFLNPNIRFPPLEIDEAAYEAVEGILREDKTITIPSNQKPLVKFLNIFPLSVQQLAKDRVLREYDFTDKNN